MPGEEAIQGSTAESPQSGDGSVRVERWPTETLLLVLVTLASAAIWVSLAVSIIGLVYVVLLGIFFFGTHLIFVAHVRGSGVRVGPEQFPDLHRRIEELGRRLKMAKLPEVYILQAGGVLNALATSFLRSRFLVLFSDLLDACGDDAAARDMIVGHELGHIRAGHLRWKWFLLPGLLVPFLGTAYSRAREYTCDRYGVALCGDRRGALRGLAILAAGAVHGPRLNMKALVEQRESLNTGWMTIGTWLGTHPPISRRIAALEPALAGRAEAAALGPLRALLILGVVVMVPVLMAGFTLKRFLPKIEEALRARSSGAGSSRVATRLSGKDEEDRQTALAGMTSLREVVEALQRSSGRPPANEIELYEDWETAHPGKPDPLDPFDGKRYGYYVQKGEWWIWSAGPDRENDTDDDIWLDQDGFSQ